ncbi:YME2, partial [Symbiodinium sp. CCMP2456]
MRALNRPLAQLQLGGARRGNAWQAAKPTEQRTVGLSYHGVLWVANVYPTQAHCFDFRPLCTRNNHETLIPQLLPSGLEFDVVPRQREGGAFVYFRMPPTFVLQVLLSAKPGAFMPKSVDDIISQMTRDIGGKFVKTHHVRARLCPHRARVHRVLGMHSFADRESAPPSSQIHVKFGVTAKKPTEEEMYEVLVRYGQLDTLVGSSAGFLASFRHIFAAIAVRNCLHGAPLKQGQKEATTWALEYKQPSVWETVAANFRFWLPLYLLAICCLIVRWSYDPPAFVQYFVPAAPVPDEGAEDTPIQYSLKDPLALVQYLVQGDVRLVRLAYLLELQESGLPWPRRQEAENAVLKSGETALVTMGELHEIQSQGTRARRGFYSRSGKLIHFGSVSHCWESREHPDPWNFQLDETIRRFRDMEGERSEVWLFIDFPCLYQYPRDNTQSHIFQRALSAMHVLYAHEHVKVEILSDLTPDAVRLKQRGRHIAVYSENYSRVEPLTVDSLLMNRVPYDQRGWCQAEQEWASLRATFAQRVPTPPALFSQRMDNCKFTHRDDSSLVKELQEKIFMQKAQETIKLNLQLAGEQVPVLCAALPYFAHLETVIVRDTKLGCEGARAIVESGAADIHLDNCHLGDAEAIAIAEALERTASVQQLNLRTTKISLAGVDALQRAARIFGGVSISLDGQRITGSTHASLKGPCPRASTPANGTE